MSRILFILLLIPACALAQKKVNVSLFGGFSNYTGDLQEKRFTLNQSHAAVGVGASYEVMPKLLVRGEFKFGKLSADDKESSKTLNRQRNLNFQSGIFDMSLLADYSLFDLQFSRVTPYVFGGLALFHFNPYTYDTAGNKFFLRPLSTEGQGLTEYPDRKTYGRIQLSLPFGVGVRFRITDNAWLGYEIGMRKTFTDYIDDVSTTYVNPAALLANRGAKSVELSFRSNELKNVNLPYPPENTIRGGFRHKDWYYFSGLTLSIGLFNDAGKSTMFTGKRGSVNCPGGVL
jgi:hypothetical protein